MKKAHIDNEGNLLGWYDTEVHTDIPTPNIEFTDSEWKEALGKNANAYENGLFIKKDTRTQAEIDQEKENAEWGAYSSAEEADKRSKWKVGGKPVFTPTPQG